MSPQQTINGLLSIIFRQFNDPNTVLRAPFVYFDVVEAILWMANGRPRTGASSARRTIRWALRSNTEVVAAMEAESRLLKGATEHWRAQATAARLYLLGLEDK